MDVNINLECIECPACHVLMWITEKHKRRLEESKETFYCPNGHSQVYPGKSDKERIREADNKAYWMQQESERWKEETRKLKKKITALKKKAKK